MPRFSVLASGSSGNAAILEANGFGLLIDIGLGPRLLGSRLASLGLSWKDVHAVLLTHVHGDHWKDRTLAQLRTRRIPLYCHPAHVETLSFYAPAFASLQDAGLVRLYTSFTRFELPQGLSCIPIAVPHDSDPTFAFRIEGPIGLFHNAWALGYAADLGVVPPELIDLFGVVDLLALEFNHDEEMERTSGRPRHLIDRVLGDQGHLSNRQAAESLRSILQASPRSSLRHVVQLHLSQHCNRPTLAQSAARRILDGLDQTIAVSTAHQDRATKFFDIDAY